MPSWIEYMGMLQQQQQARQQAAQQLIQFQQAQQDRQRQQAALAATGNAFPAMFAQQPQAPPQMAPTPQPPAPGQSSQPMQQAGGVAPGPVRPPLPPSLPPFRPMPTAGAAQASAPPQLSQAPAPATGGAVPSGLLSLESAVKALKDQGLSGAELMEGLGLMMPVLDVQAKQQTAQIQQQFQRKLQLAQLQERYDSLRQRAEDNALNRADREQAHADSIGIRQQMLRIQGNPDSAIDDDDAKVLGEMAAHGDTSVFTNLGRGAQGAKNVIKVRKAEIQYAKDHDLTPGDLAAANVQFQGEKAGARTAAVRSANISMAANEANQLADQALSVSGELSRTGARDVNSALNNLRGRFGDTRVAQFQVAINGFKNAYSRAISPSGTPTVHDKQHADELFSMDQSPEQFAASLEQAKREIAAALKAPGEVQSQQRARISGRSVTEPSAGGLPAGWSVSEVPK